ncbi:MAG: hypothetical protein R3C19_10440 [Planctomycetaceae bacterium]
MRKVSAFAAASIKAIVAVVDDRLRGFLNEPCTRRDTCRDAGKGTSYDAPRRTRQATQRCDKWNRAARDSVTGSPGDDPVFF